MRKKTSTPKNFVLDTNVLLHDPDSLVNFEDNNVYIPVEVIEELDKFKTENTTRGHHARQVHRHLDLMFPNEAAMREGCAKASGGMIQVVVNPWVTQARKVESPAMKRMVAMFPDINKPDNRILASALSVGEQQTKSQLVLVSKDMNMRLKARRLGMEAQDYMNDKAKDDDVEPHDYDRFEIAGNELQQFCSRGSLDLDLSRVRDLESGYLLLQNQDTGATKPAKYLGNGEFRVLNFPNPLSIRGGMMVKPRNLGQQFLLDAIFDDSVSLVTVYGKAGTGKTIVSVAAGLSQVQAGRYDKLMVTRSVIPMGKDIGFLPGTIEDKMRPWVQPIYDAVEAILTRQKPEQFRDKPQRKDKQKQQDFHGHEPHSKAIKPYQRLIEDGTLEVEALSQIRGRSIPRSFFILDEAQNITPHEAKTIATRMSEGSKLLMIGDPAQIDNAYVDRWSNGLVYTRNKLKGQPLASHISLINGERSELAELAANLM